LGLRKFFRSVITADNGLKGKPDPAMFLKSAENLGVVAENCIVFEDAVGGFEAAHRARMRSIGIATVNSIEKILGLDGVVEAHTDFSNLAPMELIEKYLKPAAAAM
jgi:beta-phosphoglucomutase-like phosphatase (HAD superfamily)